MVSIVMPKTAQEFDLLSSQAAQNAAAARAQNAQIDSGFYPAQVEQLKSATAANRASAATEQARLVGLNQQNEVAQMNLEDAKASAIAQRAAATRIQNGAPVQQSVGSVPQAGPANQGDAQVVQAPQATPQQVAPAAPAIPAPVQMAMPTAAPQGQAGAVQLPVAPIGGAQPPADKGRPPLPEFKPAAAVVSADPLVALAKNNELAPGIPNYVSDRNIAIYVEEAQKAGVRPQAIQANVQAMLKAREDQAKRIIEYRKEAEMMRKEGLSADKINTEIAKLRKDDMNDDAYSIIRRVASKNPGVQQAAVAEAQIKLGIDITSPEGKARIATMAEDSELFKKDVEQARKDRDTASMIGRREAETAQGQGQLAISKRNSDISAGHLSLAQRRFAEEQGRAKASDIKETNRVKGVDLNTRDAYATADKQISEVDRLVSGGKIENASGIENFLGLTKIPGTSWRQDKQDIINVVNNAVLNYKQALTQAGGSVRMFDANKEAEALEKAVANMDWNAGDTFIRQQLDNIRSRMSDSMQRLNQARSAEGLPRLESTSTTKAETPALPADAPKASDYKPGFIRNGMIFNGGDSTNPANWRKVR